MPNVRQCWWDYHLRWLVLVELLLAEEALTELYAALMRWSVAVLASVGAEGALLGPLFAAPTVGGDLLL